MFLKVVLLTNRIINIIYGDIFWCDTMKYREELSFKMLCYEQLLNELGNNTKRDCFQQLFQDS